VFHTTATINENFKEKSKNGKFIKAHIPIPTKRILVS
jgi:hypothetical protein